MIWRIWGKEVMQRSIIFKYFTIYLALVLLSIAVLGAGIMAFATMYFKDENYQQLEVCAQKGSWQITQLLDENTVLDQDLVTDYLSVMASSVSGELLLSDLDGTLLLSSQPDSPLVGKQMDSRILDQLRLDGSYREMGYLGGLFPAHYNTVALPIYDQSQQPIGYFFACAPAGEPLNSFLLDFLQVFSVASVIVLAVVSVIIYFVSRQLVKPLRQMSEAAAKMSSGDFSQQLMVDSDDELGQLALAMNHMAQSLSSLETMRRSFISNVSHELKTPMTTISGFVDGILDGTIPPDQQKKYLRIVSEEVNRLSRLVVSMLNLSRIEAGEMRLTRQKVDVVDSTIQTLFQLESQIEKRELQVEGLEHEPLYVDADPDLLHQVIYNLTENACKFADQGGTLSFSFEKEGNRAMVGVRNTGEGLSKQEISRVFDRFYKTDRSRGLDKTGVGLGLYIVRSILTLHGGDIIVRSVKGEYTEFVFTLPLYNPMRKFKKKPDGKEDPNGKS